MMLGSDSHPNNAFNSLDAERSDCASSLYVDLQSNPSHARQLPDRRAALIRRPRNLLNRKKQPG